MYICLSLSIYIYMASTMTFLAVARAVSSSEAARKAEHSSSKRSRRNHQSM